MRLSRMLEVGARASRLEQWVSRCLRPRRRPATQRLLLPALRHRGLVLIVATVLFVLSLGIVELLRQEFIPSQDMGRFGIRFQTARSAPASTTTERILGQIERFLLSAPRGRPMYGGFVGGFGGGEVNSGMVFVTLKEHGERPLDPKTGKRLSQQDLMDVARAGHQQLPRARGS